IEVNSLEIFILFNQSEEVCVEIVLVSFCILEIFLVILLLLLVVVVFLLSLLLLLLLSLLFLFIRIFFLLLLVLLVFLIVFIVFFGLPSCSPTIHIIILFIIFILIYNNKYFLSYLLHLVQFQRVFFLFLQFFHEILLLLYVQINHHLYQRFTKLLFIFYYY